MHAWPCRVTLTKSHARVLMERNEFWSLADDDYLFNLATLFREERVKLPPVIVHILLQRNIGSANIGK